MRICMQLKPNRYYNDQFLLLWVVSTSLSFHEQQFYLILKHSFTCNALQWRPKINDIVKNFLDNLITCIYKFEEHNLGSI